MMPKGVEHKGWAGSHRPPGTVKIPMMPKGVEHKREKKVRYHVAKVKIPMMPKGVEHLRLSPPPMLAPE